MDLSIVGDPAGCPMVTRTSRIAGAALAAALWSTAAGAQTPPVNVDKLPVDLQRIQRQLRQDSSREETDGLRLRYFIDVYGQTPPIVIFGPEANLSSGPVPYGGPTHREMLEQMTPREYRPAAADLSALFRWLAERAKK